MTRHLCVVVLLHVLVCPVQSSLWRTLQGFGVGGGLKTLVPTPAPTKGSVALPFSDDDLFEFSYQYKLFVASAGKRVVDGIQEVEEAAEVELKRFIDEKNANVEIDRLESNILGSCVETDQPFPDFPECNYVETTVFADVDFRVDRDIVEDVVLDDVRLNFIPNFNANSLEARVWYEYPIPLFTELTVRLVGIAYIMDGEETIFFEGTVFDALAELLATTTDFELHSITVIRQEASPTERRFLKEGEQYNEVTIGVKAVCSDSTEECSELDLRRSMRNSAYGPILKRELNTDQKNFPYFDLVQKIQIEAVQVPTLPDPVEIKEYDHDRSGVPVWLWVVIVLDIVIIASVVLYVWLRNGRRQTQGDKLEHPDEKPEQPKVPALTIPTIFPMKKEEDKEPAKTTDEIEDEKFDNDSNYDAFSVEAGDMSNKDDEDEDFAAFSGRRINPK